MNQELRKKEGVLTCAGVSLIETLVVVSMVVFLVAISVGAFPSFNSRQVLKNDSFLIKTVIEQARANTLSSQNDSAYGVHFSENNITIFVGPTYSVGSGSNVVIPLNSKTYIATTSLTGSTTDLLFERLNGKASAQGTIQIALKKDPSASTTLRVYYTGLVEN